MAASHTALSGILDCGLPYASLGDGDRDLVIFDAVRISNRPLEGLRLQGARDAYEDYLDHRRIHIIERRPEMPIDYDVTDMVADYERGVPELARLPVDLLGIGGGGLMALRYAARNPGHVRTLTLLSSAHRMSDEGRARTGRWVSWAEELRWRRIHAGFMSSMFTNPLAGALFGGIAFLAPDAVGTTDYPWDFIVGHRAVMDADCASDALEVQAPTLIITGALDLFFTPTLAEETSTMISGSRLSIYPREGHGLVKSRKKALREEILAFIEAG